jgi:hypothetical protein
VPTYSVASVFDPLVIAEGGDSGKLDYDRDAKKYIFKFTDLSTWPVTGPVNQPTKTIEYRPENIIDSSGDFTIYSRSDDADPAKTDQLKLLKFGSNNTILPLYHMSYGINSVTASTGYSYTSYFFYGAPSYFHRPESGTFTYNGLLRGRYHISYLGNTYDISGTFATVANFSLGTYTTTFSFTGINIIPTRAPLPQQHFTGSGSIFGGGVPVPLYGSFQDPTVPARNGHMEGNFFGPDAEESGQTLVYAGDESFVAVLFGKR